MYRRIINTESLCAVCNQVRASADPEVRICRDCLLGISLRRRKRDLVLLLLIWVPVVAYVWLALSNPELEGVWHFAAVAPALLIALFLSAFCYQGIVDAQRLQSGVVTPTLRLLAQRRLTNLGD